MQELYTKNWLEENLSTLDSWKRSAFENFDNMIAGKDNKYPCILGIQGYLANDLRFVFLQDPRDPKTPSDLANTLKKYGEISRDTGKYASLVVLFETPSEIIDNFTIENYENLFWSLINNTSKFDSEDWPPEVSQDPENPSWEFCFDKEPYFAFCSTPAHKSRKSRYFPSFMITFQPRWVFKDINDSTKFGKTMKKNIRQRLEKYDDVPIHPSLQWYGEGTNLEWKQYFLRDEESLPSKCPFSKGK